jgi:hypothetical protein
MQLVLFVNEIERSALRLRRDPLRRREIQNRMGSTTEDGTLVNRWQEFKPKLDDNDRAKMYDQLLIAQQIFKRRGTSVVGRTDWTSCPKKIKRVLVSLIMLRKTVFSIYLLFFVCF